MSAIKLRAARPFWHGGRIVGTSELIRVTPEQAADILAAGRAELVDDTDAAEITEAVRHEVAAALAKERAGARIDRQRGHFVTDGPWRPIFPAG